MSEPTPSKKSSTEPEPSAEPEQTAAEPIPLWIDAMSIWSWGWHIHWIGIGCLFVLLGVYAGWSIIAITRHRKRGRRVLPIFINSLLFVFGLSRSLFLLINPYESPQCYVLPKCPVLLTRLLFAVGLPCLTASFSFVHLVFVQVIKLKIYPTKLQNWKFLLLVVMFHFLLAFTVELIVYFYADSKILLLVCQIFYIVFSIVLSCSFLYTGHRIINHVNLSASRVSKMGSRVVGKTSLKAPPPRRRFSRPYTPNVSKLVKITYITAAIGVVCCGLQLYSIFGIHNIYRVGNTNRPKPVPWIIFQSLFRLVELASAITMAYVSPRQTKDTTFAMCFCCVKRPPASVMYFVSYSMSNSSRIKTDATEMKTRDTAA